ncbi:MAG: hypothetical protein WAM82_13705 [Thermoanaerobaculia bacterium]
MPFKIKDLMIDVTTASAAANLTLTLCRYPTYYCHYPSLQPCFTHTICANLTCHGVSYVTCPFGSLPTTLTLTGCGGTELPTGPGPIDLGSLKEQLRAQLAAVEEHERAAEAASRPQTREQAAELEEKLKAALNEVQSLKKTLPSKG